ncbi:MAG TPA: hypothetical protein VLB04_04295 [Methanotrichaceae archaeon]|nr:hypothetical protein [Methanotrichaceae archaeon]
MNRPLLCLILLLTIMCAPALSQNSPNIEFTEAEEGGGVAVDARITDQDGDLASATLYALDENTLDVLWTEHRIIQGGDAKLTFFWPRQSWRATNGTDYVQPVLAVNTLDMPPEEAPYLVYSAPCILELIPGEQETTALAYFDNEGVFHSLTDLSGNSFYKSNEYLAITSPEISYGSYIRSNITPIVGVTTLSFLRLNLDEGLSPLLPLILDRSPIHHYTLSLENVDAKSIPYIIEIEADDTAGNRSRMFSKNPA